jgi:hypothetical protein
VKPTLILAFAVERTRQVLAEGVIEKHRATAISAVC